MTALLGHDDAWREWRAAIAGPRMHHAWILAGREGLGKARFAEAAAAELVARGTSSPQPGLDAHPDILKLEPLPASDDEAKKAAEGRKYLTKRNISVDQVRGIQRRLVTRPTLGPERAVIIDAADDLEKSAINALLKSLEEPPQGTVFLLVTHRLGHLLPTVRSRCAVLRFTPLADDAVARAVAREVPEADAQTRADAVALAAGSPGEAIRFAAMGIAGVRRVFDEIARTGDPELAGRGRLAGMFGPRPDRDTQGAVIEAAQRFLAARLPDASPMQRLCIADAADALTRLGNEAPTYNYDPGILLGEVAGLLATLGQPRG